MKRLYTASILFLLLFTIFSACSQTPKSTEGKVSLVSPEVFNEKLQSMKDSRILLDVRTPGEYKKGHLENAILIDIFRDDFTNAIKQLDTNKTIFVYCGVGGRSEEAAQMLLNIGFKNIYDLDGGFSAWQNKNLPVSLAP